MLLKSSAAKKLWKKHAAVRTEMLKYLHMHSNVRANSFALYNVHMHAT